MSQVRQEQSAQLWYRSLCARGFHVVAMDSKPATSLHYSAEQVTWIEYDVSDPSHWARAISEIESRKLWGLVTVAAINRPGFIDEYSVEDWDQMMAVNVRGVFLAIRSCVPFMRANGGGSIVNLSSVSAFIGSVGGAAYHSTKGAVLSLSRSLAQELAPSNIRVNFGMSRWVDTPFTSAYLDAQSRSGFIQTEGREPACTRPHGNP